jgi:hypothetical protein
MRKLSSLSVYYAESRVKPVLLSIVCAIFFLAGESSLLAAAESSKAIVPPSGPDAPYLYVSLDDASQIAKRIARSELLRPEYWEYSYIIKEMLREFPAIGVSFLAEDAGLQMAWDMNEDAKPALDRIAKGAASAAEASGVFGKLASTIETFEIVEPEEDNLFYELRPLGLYFSSADGLLIFGETPESVKKSIAASGGGIRRFSPKKRIDSRNTVIIELNSEMSEEIVRSSAILDGGMRNSLKTPIPRLKFEGGVTLKPDGWNLDFFTNAVRLIYNDYFKDRLSTKPAGSFLPAGGGKLVAAVDSTPDFRWMLDAGYNSMLFSPIKDLFDEMGFSLSEFINQEQEEEIAEVILSIDRVNLAVTEDQSGSANGYLLLSNKTEGAIGRAEEILSGAIDSYNETRSDDLKKFYRFPSKEWKTVYSLGPMNEGDEPAGFTLAFRDDLVLAGFISPDLLSVPFSSESELYASIEKDDTAMEKIYLDMRAIRKMIGALLDKNAPSARHRSLLLSLLLPLIDSKEIGMRTFSDDRFQVNFKTGWPNFDDRELIQKLMK